MAVHEQEGGSRNAGGNAGLESRFEFPRQLGIGENRLERFPIEPQSAGGFNRPGWERLRRQGGPCLLLCVKQVVHLPEGALKAGGLSRDSGQDGLSRTITARLYERGPGNTGTELASVTLSGTDGQLIGGTRYVPLATPLYLPRGFDGTMVAEGYGAGEPLLNSHGGAPTMWATYSGDGVVSFVGSGRWGTAGLFPTNADGGPVDRYAAGSFMFQPVGDPLPIGSIQPVPVANGSFESPVRPQQPAGGYWGPADNWTHVGPAGGGHFHPAATIFTDPIPDGNQVAYVNAGSIISDPLPGPGLEADTLYILDVDWGHRTDTPGTLYPVSYTHLTLPTN